MQSRCMTQPPGLLSLRGVSLNGETGNSRTRRSLIVQSTETQTGTLVSIYNYSIHHRMNRIIALDSKITLQKNQIKAEISFSRITAISSIPFLMDALKMDDVGKCE